MKQNIKIKLTVFLLLFSQQSFCMSPGSLDTSFNPTPAPGLQPGTNETQFTSGSDDEAFAVALQTINGQLKIILAGTTNPPSPALSSFAVARYNATQVSPSAPAGVLDQTFNGTGIETEQSAASRGDFGVDVVVQSDQKIIVGGTGTGTAETSDVGNFEAQRYLPNGGLDPSYGTGQKPGISLIPIKNESGTASAIALQQDGKLVIVGKDNVGDIVIVRLTNTGLPDPEFTNTIPGLNGVYISPPSFTSFIVADVAIQSDSKILFAGTNSTGPIPPTSSLFLGRLNSDGSPDTSFGPNGIIIFPNSDFGDNNFNSINALALQTDGKIVVVGSILTGGGININFFVGRFNPDGTLDTTFNSPNGFVNDPLSTFGSGAFDVAIACDGKIVVVGQASTARFASNFAVVTYLSNGTRDPNFGANGLVTTQIDTNASNIARGVAIQPDTKIVAGGQTNSGARGSVSLFAVARYISDISSTLNILMPTPNQVFKTKIVKISGTSSVPAGSIINITVNKQGGAQVFSGTAVVGNDGTWSITTNQLKSGTYTATVTNNCAATASVNFSIKSIPPIVCDEPADVLTVALRKKFGE